MRVLGVDPGVARTGVAVVAGEPGSLRLVHAACIETDSARSDAAGTCAFAGTEAPGATRDQVDQVGLMVPD